MSGMATKTLLAMCAMLGAVPGMLPKLSARSTALMQTPEQAEARKIEAEKKRERKRAASRAEGGSK